MQPKNNKNSVVNFLAKSVGFVDTMCCYSYTTNQLDSEEPEIDFDMNSLQSSSPAVSWDAADEHDEQIDLRIAQRQAHQETNVQKPHHQQFSQSRHTGHLHLQGSSHRHFDVPKGTLHLLPKGSPGNRSVGTASTVTTSSTTTVVTSSRLNEKLNQSLNASFENIQRRYAQDARYNRCPSLIQVDKTRRANTGCKTPAVSNSSPSQAILFSSATEGYQC
mmetsp:Transcript_10208/g.14648  ORF Transcript_10208/g.14648 Transcript_10208/m.14648 type:complete len:219 (+) Transcript_10208:178-834(+)|eukprot:CAMPEP_0202453046 /NCGR_PEP_ID=MMETSP1360-20130828/11114_1 /ASSEMBLY_ACC=CAM_ASM_000848 /TAXON_ID=515479 /ORGANISM="Licmophora paradoxa, Strain CCMP2313" /LENGTH=218 /DNA_ID=CAMNT_0049072035 /DNA_START=169 /DNA_END=825 /DNA_ORIENTATION=-